MPSYFSLRSVTTRRSLNTRYLREHEKIWRMSVLPWRSTLLRFPCRYQKAIQRTRMRFLVGPAYDPHGPLILTLQEVPDDCVRFGWIGLDICQTGPAEIAEHQVQGRGLGTRGSPLTTTGISLISVLPQ